MKINLGCGDDIRDGYINVDINKQLKGVNIIDIKDFAKAYSEQQGTTATEILLLNVAHQFTPNEFAPILADLKKILAPGGSIVITDVDYDIIANLLVYKNMDIIGLNQLLYRPGQRGLFSLTNIIAHAESIGLFVEESYYNGVNFGVKLGNK